MYYNTETTYLKKKKIFFENFMPAGQNKRISQMSIWHLAILISGHFDYCSDIIYIIYYI